MAADIISTLNANDLNEFKKDFSELIRVYYGINKEYSKMGKDIDRQIKDFKQIINLFNKKYKNLVIRLKMTPEELKLRILIKEKSVKDIFVNVASKLNGLKSIGASDSGDVKIEEADRFSKELDRIKNKMFVSYHEKEAAHAISLEKGGKDMVELHYSEGVGNERSPEFKLCGYYAIKGGIKKINIIERLSAMGFVEDSVLDKVRNFFKRFNPRIEE